MGFASTILDALIFGVRDVFADAVAFPRRTGMNFVGATLTDDPTNGRTNVSIPGVLGAGIPFPIDGASAAIASGQWSTMATGAVTVTLATAGTLAAAPGVFGIAMESGNPGDTIDWNVELMVPAAISGL